MRRLLRALLPLGVLFVGAAIFLVLVKTRPAPAKKAIEQRGTLVEVMTVHRGRERVTVQAQGTVIPARQVVLQAEVSGRIVWQHAELVPGGRVRKGETLVRIDPREYVLSMEQQRANVDRARLDLQVEKSRKTVAEREWRVIDPRGEAPDEGRALALREPQLDTAEASVKAAESAHAQARLAVERATIQAPFNAFVKEEAVEVGQLVGPQAQLATLVGTDTFWVQVAVPMTQLTAIRVPGMNAREGEGARARVVQDVGEPNVEREGRVLRLLGDLDPVGRMGRILVEIEDPLGLSAGRDGGAQLPLLVGAYVQVEIEGQELDGVIEVPRKALRDGDRVYVYGEDDRLRIRPVSIVWRKDAAVLVNGGLEDGDEIITSRLSSPVDGMLLRKADPEDAKKALGRR